MICGSTGCIGMGTGWTPPAFILKDPTWTAAGGSAWTPITGASEPGGAKNVAGEANRAIVADLIQAVETDTQPRTDARAGRTTIEMVLACYASQARGGVVTLPLADRASHPLTRLSRP